MSVDSKTAEVVKEKLEHMLTDLKSRISEDLADFHKKGSHSTGGLDRGDESEHEQELHFAMKTVSREADDIKHAEDALYRIEQGNYGECSDCGEDIGTARLLANPIATRCVDCQNKKEETFDERDATPSL